MPLLRRVVHEKLTLAVHLTCGLKASASSVKHSNWITTKRDEIAKCASISTWTCHVIWAYYCKSSHWEWKLCCATLICVFFQTCYFLMTHRLPSTLSLARRSASISTLQPSYRASPMKHQLHCEMQKLRGRTSNILLRSLFYVKRSKISVIDRWYPMVPTDGFILDLEDAVPYEKKLETRRHVAGALNLIPPSDFPHILVRMNCLSDDHPDAHWKDDIEQTAHRRLLAYIIPKVRHPEEVQEVSAYLNHCESAMRLPFGHHKVRNLATPLPLSNIPSDASLLASRPDRNSRRCPKSLRYRHF